MTAEVELVLTARPLERVACDIAVAGFFTDERPLRGGAARADWRLCGGLSRRIESGDLSGKSGEAMLIGSGFNLMVLGLVCDIIAVNRKLLEEARFRLLRIEYRINGIRDKV